MPAFDWGPWGTLASLGAAAVLGVAALRVIVSGEHAPPVRSASVSEVTVVKGEARHERRVPSFAPTSEDLHLYLVADEETAAVLRRWLAESANIAAAEGRRVPTTSVVVASGPEDEDRIRAYIADLDNMRVFEHLSPVTVIDVRGR